MVSLPCIIVFGNYGTLLSREMDVQLTRLPSRILSYGNLP